MASGQSLAPLGAAIPVSKNLKALQRVTAAGGAGHDLTEGTGGDFTGLSRKDRK